MILCKAYGDVTGNGKIDEVYLTGIKTSESPFIKNITLQIKEGIKGEVYHFPLEESVGYQPCIYLYDFTGNGVLDLFISIASGSSGALMYYFIYSFEHNNLQLLFNYKIYNKDYQYEVNYLDHYKVEIISDKNHKKYIIDLTNKGKVYLYDLYNEDGTLKKHVTGWVDPISGLYPVDFRGNKVFDLVAIQQISGLYHADGLGFIENVLIWDQKAFELSRQSVGVFGKNI